MKEFNDSLRELIIKNNSFEVEKLLEQQVKKFPRDIDLWLKLCMTRINTPIEDGEKALECIEVIYQLNNENFYAHILEYEVFNVIFGFVEDEHYNKLANLRTNHKEQLSIIKYLTAFYWYFTKRNISRTIEVLQESIRLNDKYVNNYNFLGDIYLENGNKEDGLQLKRKAVSNIQFVYPSNYIHDCTDINEYISEFITGIHVSKGRDKEILEGWK